MKIFYDELNGMLCIDESVHIVGCGAVVTTAGDVVEIAQSKSNFNNISEPYVEILDYNGEYFETIESCVEYIEGEIYKCLLFFRGDTAYEIAVANGFVGTEVEWLASLVGADADPVPAGVKWETYSNVVPDGWYILNGQNISSAANPILASIFGESGGFVTLPDERSRGSKMVSASTTIGQHVGNDTQNINHTHSFSATSTSAGGHNHGGATGSAGSQAVGILSLLSSAAPPNHTHTIAAEGNHTHVVSGTTGSGGTATLDVRGAVTYLNWIIKGG